MIKNCQIEGCQKEGKEGHANRGFFCDDHSKSLWGIEPTFDAGRAIQIYEALKKIPFESLIDIGCGYGLVGDSLKWVFPNKNITHFDINYFPEWEKLTKVKPYQMDVTDFIKTAGDYDVVMMLNCYRNWHGEQLALFEKWLNAHAKYFITSKYHGADKADFEIIGKDSKNFDLLMKKIKHEVS